MHGNVGIGTTNPLNTLDIGGGKIRFDGSNGYIAVGMQTWETPDHPLTINTSTTTIGTGVGIRLYSGGHTGDIEQIGFGYSHGIKPSTVIGGISESQGGTTSGGLFFATRELETNTAPLERVRIDRYGNVGIGTTGPSVKFEVSDDSSTAYVVDSGGGTRAKVTNRNTTDNSFATIDFDSGANTLARVMGIFTDTSSAVGDLAFVTRAGAFVERLKMIIEKDESLASKCQGIKVSVKIGFASYPDDGRTAKELVEKAVSSLTR